MRLLLLNGPTAGRNLCPARHNWPHVGPTRGPPAGPPAPQNNHDNEPIEWNWWPRAARFRPRFGPAPGRAGRPTCAWAAPPIDHHVGHRITGQIFDLCPFWFGAGRFSAPRRSNCGAQLAPAPRTRSLGARAARPSVMRAARARVAGHINTTTVRTNGRARSTWMLAFHADEIRLKRFSSD